MQVALQLRLGHRMVRVAVENAQNFTGIPPISIPKATKAISDATLACRRIRDDGDHQNRPLS